MDFEPMKVELGLGQAGGKWLRAFKLGPWLEASLVASLTAAVSSTRGSVLALPRDPQVQQRLICSIFFSSPSLQL